MKQDFNMTTTQAIKWVSYLMIGIPSLLFVTLLIKHVILASPILLLTFIAGLIGLKLSKRLEKDEQNK